MPIPIFVMGSARSGTTWLANIIASHDNVAAAIAVEHHGIHESHVYSYTRYCFPDTVMCNRFFAQYCQEDYCRILEPDIKTFCKNNTGAYKTTSLFRMMMNDFAVRCDCDFWLEKTPKHTVYFREIANDFPGAIFIAIHRGFNDTIKSNLMMYPRKNVSRTRQLAEKVFRYESDRKALKCLKREFPDRVLVLYYEDLVTKYAETVNAILDHVGLNKRSLASSYPSASSFTNDSEKPAFSVSDRVVMLLCKVMVRSMPFNLVVKWRKRHDQCSATGIPRSSRLAPRIAKDCL